jgi:hypothetical protein
MGNSLRVPRMKTGCLADNKSFKILKTFPVPYVRLFGIKGLQLLYEAIFLVQTSWDGWNSRRGQLMNNTGQRLRCPRGA